MNRLRLWRVFSPTASSISSNGARRTRKNSSRSCLSSAASGWFGRTISPAIRCGTDRAGHNEPDREVRAIVVVYDPLGSGNRHIGLDNSVHPGLLPVNPRHSWVPDCKRRRIDLRALVSGVVMSPWAEPDAVEEINLWIQRKEFPAAARSGLTAVHTPTLDEFRKYRHIAGQRPLEPRAPEDRDPSKNGPARTLRSPLDASAGAGAVPLPAALGSLPSLPRHHSPTRRRGISRNHFAPPSRLEAAENRRWMKLRTDRHYAVPSASALRLKSACSRSAPNRTNLSRTESRPGASPSSSGTNDCESSLGILGWPDKTTPECP